MSRREIVKTIDQTDQIPAVAKWVSDMAEKGLRSGAVMVAITRPRRNKEQNARFHAMCGDVAKQATYMNRKLSSDQWKVLFVSGHAIAEGLGADMVPGLEGEFVNLRESTSRMSVKRMSSLIEYVFSWGAQNGIEWSRKSKGEE